ncbi:hypothetical protein ACA910_000486 [Epithemia clementina (nom. ined.)]
MRNNFLIADESNRNHNHNPQLDLLSPQVRQFAEQEAPAWLLSLQSLPFACTEFGRCCFRSTEHGAVYMSQPEIHRAAQVLTGGDDVEFVHTYASHTLRKPKSNEQWIRLKKKPKTKPWRTKATLSLFSLTAANKATTTVISHNHKDFESKFSSTTGDKISQSEQGKVQSLHCCIFLDEETNHCKIYQARPIQCSTYPFYPSILESVETWNAECRRRDEDNESDLPIWTPDGTGCEGMTPIVTTAATTTTSITTEGKKKNGGRDADDNGGGVSMYKVYERLYEMQRLEEAMYRKEE